jgi:hypothetical protein
MGFLIGGVVALLVGGLYWNAFIRPDGNRLARVIVRWAARPSFRGFIRDPHHEILIVAILSSLIGLVGLVLAATGVSPEWRATRPGIR